MDLLPQFKQIVKQKKNTDAAGFVLFSLLDGKHHLIIRAIGFYKWEADFAMPVTETILVVVQREEKRLEEVAIISSNRYN